MTSTSTARIRRRLAAILGLIVALGCWAEWLWWQSFQRSREEALRADAITYATAINERLEAHFQRLELVATSILGGAELDLNTPLPAPVEEALRAYLQLHDELVAFNIQYPDGNLIYWSTRHELRQKNTVFRHGEFVALPTDELPLTRLLAPLRDAPRVGGAIVGARVAVRRASGEINHFVGAPLRAEKLFAPPPGWSPRQPLALAITDTARQRLIAAWTPKAGLGLFPDNAPNAAPPALPPPRVSITTAIYRIDTAPLSPLWQAYASDSATRWLLETVVLVALALLARHTVRLVSTTETLSQQLAAQWQRERELARTDALTHLFNRLALEEQVPRLLAGAARRGRWVAVGIVDLDDFKPINDRHGHEAGDAVLVALAERLRSLLRGSDLAARLGGDEFVLVLDDLSPLTAHEDLRRFMSRLEAALSEPIALPNGEATALHASVGWAFYPRHGNDLDALLRAADALLLHLKASKARRAAAWGVVDEEGEEPDVAPQASLDPFGPQAQRLLGAYAPLLEPLPRAFVPHLLALGERTDSVLAGLLGALSEEDRKAYSEILAQHFALHLGADTSRDALASNAAALGRLHAMEGIADAQALLAYDAWIGFVTEHLQTQALRTNELLALLIVLRERVHVALREFLRTLETIRDAYHAVLLELPEAAATPLAWWEEITAKLVRLPGMVAVLVLRPDDSGVFRALAKAHHPKLAPEILRQFLQFQPPRLDPNDPEGRGLVARAWRQGRTLVTHRYQSDPRTVAWHELARRAEVRSLAAVPLLGHGQPEALLMLAARHPHQFGAAWIQAWLDHLRQRLERGLEVARRDPANASPTSPWIAVEEADAIRGAVMSGGVRLFVQPIVRLASGALEKVEALARLQVGERLLAPGQFLPALRQPELDALFRVMLDEALAWRQRWAAQGLPLDVSVNLPPATLLHPDCPTWIAAALAQHRVAAEHLLMELLEDEPLLADEAAKAINKLAALGVKLAIDDLGSGHSSLVRLMRLPFRLIKIDQTIVRELPRAPIATLTIMRALVRLAEGLEHPTVAEGLEHWPYLEAASVLGVTHGQGYGIAQPMPAAALLAWAEAHAARCPGAYLFPAQPLSSALGALAYQWQVNHERGQALLRPLAECPITTYLNTYHPEARDAQRWHETLHTARNEQERRAAVQALLRFLLAAAEAELAALTRPSA